MLRLWSDRLNCFDAVKSHRLFCRNDQQHRHHDARFDFERHTFHGHRAEPLNRRCRRLRFPLGNDIAEKPAQ